MMMRKHQGIKWKSSGSRLEERDWRKQNLDLVSKVKISVWRNPKSERNRIWNFFPKPFFFDTESDTFFDTNFFPIPNPILFLIPKFFETNTNTFSDTKFFRNRYRYFYRHQNFSKPIPKNMERFRNRIWNFLDQNLWTGHCYNAETHSFPAMFKTWGPK